MIENTSNASGNPHANGKPPPDAPEQPAPGSNIGSRHGRSKLTEALVTVIRSELASGERVGELAVRYGVSQTTISFIKARRNWRHV